MDLDETWQEGLRPEKTKPCTFPAKSRYRFRRQREKMGRRGVVFLWREPRNTSATFLRSISAKLSTTRVQVASRDTWFHIPKKFPLRDRISRKTVFLGYFRVPCLCPAYVVTGNVLRRLDCFHPLVDIPQIYPSRNVDAYICFKHTHQGAQPSDRHAKTFRL